MVSPVEYRTADGWLGWSMETRHPIFSPVGVIYGIYLFPDTDSDVDSDDVRTKLERRFRNPVRQLTVA